MVYWDSTHSSCSADWPPGSLCPESALPISSIWVMTFTHLMKGVLWICITFSLFANTENGSVCMIGKWSKMDWCRLSDSTNQLFIRKRNTLSCDFFFNLPYHALNLISFYIVTLSCTAVCIVGLQKVFFFNLNCFYFKNEYNFLLYWISVRI